MPLYEYQCTSEPCSLIFEEYRPVSDHQKIVPCPRCQLPSHRVYLPSAPRSEAPSVVVHRAPDGSYRFPGSPDARMPEGYTRVELRGWQEVRRFEKEVNKRQFSEICRRVERQQSAIEEGERRRRSDLYAAMGSFSNRNKALARLVIERNNRKGHPQTYEPGFYVEAFSQDRSSREPHRDPEGRKTRD